MSDQFLYETLSPIIVIVLIAFLSAEFIGRSKHIGRGYTFFMMLGIIPGIIGLLFSPSAKNKPSQGNVFHTAFGVFLIIAVIVMLYNLTDNFTYVNVFSTVSILASAIYCIQLSGGEVINNMPKYYFDTQDIQEVTIHKTKRNLDETISNLTDLKNKGILTEEEYQTKVEKINQEQSEQGLKNSPEYKQLKSLLDSGTLTKEEFEDKVILIKTRLTNRNSADRTDRVDEIKKYIEGPELSTRENAKGKSKNIYLLSILFISVIIGLVLFLSNLIDTDSKQKNDFSPTITTNSATDSYMNTNQPMINKKFVYVVLEVEKPRLEVFEPKGYVNSLGFYERLDPIYSITYEKEIYATDIIEVKNYNIDEKYKVLDDSKRRMYSKLNLFDQSFSTDLWIKCKDNDKREEFKNVRSKLLKSQIFEFDSYSEASIHKNNNLE